MISYVKGNIFRVPVASRVVIAHIVNNVGAFGRGFAADLAFNIPKAKQVYLDEYKDAKLGDVVMHDATTPEGKHVVIAHLFAQNGLPGPDNHNPIRYGALTDSLDTLAGVILDAPDPYEVWMPRIGTGYARGDWMLIEGIVRDTLTRVGIRVTVFDKED